MEQGDFSTNSSHRKGAHLKFKERVIIQTRLLDGWSLRRIAREIGCAVNTVRNEIKRGKVLKYNGKVVRYSATDGQETYRHNRENCGRKNLAVKAGEFLKFVIVMFIKYRWSLDACFGFALKTGLFKREDMVCTKTLYNYVELGLLKRIKNMDLPLKVKRKNRKKIVRLHKKKLGRNIETRDKSIDERKEFGHWECDLVIGKRSKDEVLLTIVERKTRFSIIITLPNKEADSVMKAFESLKVEFGEYFDKVFKTLTTDNGSEFSDLSDLEKLSSILVYFTHPYSSWEKGTNENHNGLFRRFIPKGKNISDFSLQYIANVARWANSLPRKILGYKSPEEVFVAEFWNL